MNFHLYTFYNAAGKHRHICRFIVSALVCRLQQAYLWMGGVLIISHDDIESWLRLSAHLPIISYTNMGPKILWFDWIDFVSCSILFKSLPHQQPISCSNHLDKTFDHNLNSLSLALSSPLLHSFHLKWLKMNLKCIKEKKYISDFTSPDARHSPF